MGNTAALSGDTAKTFKEECSKTVESLVSPSLRGPRLTDSNSLSDVKPRRNRRSGAPDSAPPPRSHPSCVEGVHTLTSPTLATPEGLKGSLAPSRRPSVCGVTLLQALPLVLQETLNRRAQVRRRVVHLLLGVFRCVLGMAYFGRRNDEAM